MLKKFEVYMRINYLSRAPAAQGLFLLLLVKSSDSRYMLLKWLGAQQLNVLQVMLRECVAVIAVDDDMHA